MKKIGIIGHVYSGKTTLTAAIKSVLDKEKHLIFKDTTEEVFVYKNSYAFLNEKQPASKSLLKKCKKGLHEYSESQPIKGEGNFFKTEWKCIHCGESRRSG